MASPISEILGEFEGDDRRSGTCDQHGEFIDIYHNGKGRLPEGWAGCPQCAERRHRHRMRQEEDQRQMEMGREKAERYVAASGIPKRFADKGFDSYIPTNGKAVANMRQIREYGDAIVSGNHKGRSLILVGNVGTGKTHLSCALLEDTTRRSCLPGKYLTFSELVRQVKGSWRKDSGYTENEVYKDFSKPELVILDEVGVQNFSEFEQTVAYEAINARYLDEKPTVLVTNLPANKLSECLGERVVDRLRENGGRALDFDWGSYRAGGAA